MRYHGARVNATWGVVESAMDVLPLCSFHYTSILYIIYIIQFCLSWPKFVRRILLYVSLCCADGRSSNSAHSSHTRGIQEASGNGFHYPYSSLGPTFCSAPRCRNAGIWVILKTSGCDDLWLVTFHYTFYYLRKRLQYSNISNSYCVFCRLFLKASWTCFIVESAGSKNPCCDMEESWGGLVACLLVELLFVVDLLPALGDPWQVNFQGYEGTAPFSLWAVVVAWLHVSERLDWTQMQSDSTPTLHTCAYRTPMACVKFVQFTAVGTDRCILLERQWPDGEIRSVACRRRPHQNMMWWNHLYNHGRIIKL